MKSTGKLIKSSWCRIISTPRTRHPLSNLPAPSGPALDGENPLVLRPKPASWLNMAETLISVLERGCLRRRVGSAAEVVKQVATLEHHRNARQAKINWQFNCELARTKRQRLYPKLAAF